MKVYTFEVHITVDGTLTVDVEADSEEEARGLILDQIADREIAEMADCDADGAALIDAEEV